MFFKKKHLLHTKFGTNLHLKCYIVQKCSRYYSAVLIQCRTMYIESYHVGKMYFKGVLVLLICCTVYISAMDHDISVCTLANYAISIQITKKRALAF